MKVLQIGNNMKITTATINDIPAVTEALSLFYAEAEPLMSVDLNIADLESTLVELHDNKKVVILIAKHDEKVIGTIILLHNAYFFNYSEHYVQELVFWVAPEYRNAGVGTLLKNDAEQLAKNLGCAEIYMLDLLNNQQSFYTKAGYTKQPTYCKRLV